MGFRLLMRIVGFFGLLAVSMHFIGPLLAPAPAILAEARMRQQPPSPPRVDGITCVRRTGDPHFPVWVYIRLATTGPISKPFPAEVVIDFLDDDGMRLIDATIRETVQLTGGLLSFRGPVPTVAETCRVRFTDERGEKVGVDEASAPIAQERSW